MRIFPYFSSALRLFSIFDAVPYWLCDNKKELVLHEAYTAAVTSFDVVNSDLLVANDCWGCRSEVGLDIITLDKKVIGTSSCLSMRFRMVLRFNQMLHDLYFLNSIWTFHGSYRNRNIPAVDYSTADAILHNLFALRLLSSSGINEANYEKRSNYVLEDELHSCRARKKNDVFLRCQFASGVIEESISTVFYLFNDLLDHGHCFSGQFSFPRLRQFSSFATTQTWFCDVLIASGVGRCFGFSVRYFVQTAKYIDEL